MSGRFLIDSNGIIRSVDVHPDHTTRPEPDEILEFMRSMAGQNRLKQTFTKS
jgi:alkyl hydroperoxide reductase subunit AhpC